MNQWETLKAFADARNSEGVMQWLADNEALIQRQVAEERAKKIFGAEHSVAWKTDDSSPYYDDYCGIIVASTNWSWSEELWNMLRTRDSWAKYPQDIFIREHYIERPLDKEEDREGEYCVYKRLLFCPDSETTCLVHIECHYGQRRTLDYGECVLPESIPFPPEMSLEDLETQARGLYAKHRDDLFDLARQHKEPE